jgi:hypothetical protein
MYELSVRHSLLISRLLLIWLLQQAPIGSVKGCPGHQTGTPEPLNRGGALISAQGLRPFFFSGLGADSRPLTGFLSPSFQVGKRAVYELTVFFVKIAPNHPRSAVMAHHFRGHRHTG